MPELLWLELFESGWFLCCASGWDWPDDWLLKTAPVSATNADAHSFSESSSAHRTLNWYWTPADDDDCGTSLADCCDWAVGIFLLWLRAVFDVSGVLFAALFIKFDIVFGVAVCVVCALYFKLKSSQFNFLWIWIWLFLQKNIAFWSYLVSNI